MKFEDYTKYMTFDSNKAINFTVTNDVYEEVVRLTTPARDAGTYKVGQSMIFNLNSVTTAAFFRFSTDGGTVWTEMRVEPKDINDQIVKNYTFVEDHLGGAFELIVEARKENATDVLAIHRMDLTFDRKI